MNKIKPSFIKPHWILRGGLILLFPPIFVFFVLPIGYFITFPFNGSEFIAGLIGYPIAIGAVCVVAVRIYYGTTFEISPTGITHNLDFLWSKRKAVLFVNVKEIELKIGPFQKFFGLGTIVLHTQASATDDTKAGLSLFDVEDPTKIYEFLKENMSKANRASAC